MYYSQQSVWNHWLFFCDHSATPSSSYAANVEGFNEYVMERTKFLVNDFPL